MIPLNADRLIALRQSGRTPERPVTINLGTYKPLSGEITILPSMPVDRLDLRCVVGLYCVLFSAGWADREAAIYARLQEYAEELCVQVADFGEDIGWWWVNRWHHNDGRIDFGKRYLLTVWEEARSHCTTAKDKAEHARWMSVESAAYAVLTGN
jgi:hypothetical protein